MAWAKLAITYAAQKNNQRAREAFEQVRTLNPSLADKLRGNLKGIVN
ncbi:MAG: hypothetical protein JSR54_00845 [Proteobacteria bacterium]|nr:hypothetical protein [Pseudomonadota bacterium]